MAKEIKVGLFIVGCVAVLGWATMHVRDFVLFENAGYDVTVHFSSAQGIRAKTAVELAGIPIGYVKDIHLIGSKIAEVILHIQKEVVLSEDSVVAVKTRGFLGETYLEVIPGNANEAIPPGGMVSRGVSSNDFNSLADQMSAIAVDLKAITSSLRANIEGEDSRVSRSLQNIEVITQNLAAFTQKNSDNFNVIAANLAALTQDLKLMLANNRANVDQTLARIANVTQKIDEGKGTIGKLVNDDATVEKLNTSLDSLNEVLGGVNRLKTELGYHTEYLGQAGDLKHYVSLVLKPRPDKYFLVELVADPNPSPIHETQTRTVTSGGSTSTVTTDTQTTDFSEFRFSAEIAKKFYDFTIRGGVIESTGGVGLNYERGPAGLAFDAFDFQNSTTNNPHLKAWGHLNVTKNIYLLSGIDDFISDNGQRDWFAGAGIQFVDEDIKSLIGAIGLKP